ncbi:hypothetical protein C0J52_18930, partial [Blattella germanica]
QVVYQRGGVLATGWLTVLLITLTNTTCIGKIPFIEVLIRCILEVITGKETLIQTLKTLRKTGSYCIHISRHSANKTCEVVRPVRTKGL